MRPLCAENDEDNTMALNIISKDQPIPIDHLVVMVYGQPGVGKTSMACTAAKPILFDFDRGSHRSAYRQDSVQIMHWRELDGLTREDVAPFDTIVIDTVGRCLDALAIAIIEENPKMGNASGGLSLQGYGALKARFAAYLNRMRSFGKDVVLIAHHKEDKQGDDVMIRPDVTGGSYAEIMKVADSCGFASMRGKNRTLDFNPTELYTGKNPAEFEPLQVPHFDNDPEWFAGIVQSIKDHMGQISESARQSAKQVMGFREQIDQVQNVAGLNAQLDIILGCDDLPETVQLQAKRLLWERAKQIGAVYDKEQARFFGEAPTEDQAPAAQA